MSQVDPHTHEQRVEMRRDERLAEEARGVAQARAELDAGLYVDADDVDAWIDSMGTERPLPVPPTRRL